MPHRNISPEQWRRAIARRQEAEKRDALPHPVVFPLGELDTNAAGQREQAGAALTMRALVNSTSHASGLSKAIADKAVHAVIETISNALSTGDEVKVMGFGTFSVSERSAKKGRNPRTGETIQIPSAKVPKFKPGKGLKDAVN